VPLAPVAPFTGEAEGSADTVTVGVGEEEALADGDLLWVDVFDGEAEVEGFEVSSVGVGHKPTDCKALAKVVDLPT
jgi:hypothetical protein